MTKGKIEEEWESYLNEVMPLNADAKQRQESQRAFYAGASAMQLIMVRDISDEEEISAEDINAMIQVLKEIAEFWKSVI